MDFDIQDPSQEEAYEDPHQDPEEQEESGEAISLTIELGDIIQIIAPTHQEIHDHIFLVDYVSSRKIKLIDADSLEKIDLKLDATGQLTDESITTIKLLSRADEKGYARQNNLVVSTWVDIRFGGDVPAIITGMITNLEEDMIEIRTYPEDEMIYINFEYMGIPENIPIEEIKIRPPPAAFAAESSSSSSSSSGAAAVSASGAGEEGGQVGEAGFLTMGMDALSGVSGSLTPREQRRRERLHARGREPDEEIKDQPIGESEHTVLGSSSAASAASGAASGVPVSALREKLRSIIIDADQIEVGEELDVLVQTVDIPDENRRFNLDKQCDDLLDALITNVPSLEKTRTVMTHIQRMVLRFRELRHKFSQFDENGNPTVPPHKSALYRPLVDTLMRMDHALRWIIPVVRTKKVIYDIPIDERTASEMDIVPRLIQQERETENQLQRQWYDGSLTYAQYMTNLSARHFTPSYEPRYTHDIISSRQVNENITAVIDNLDDFYSSVVNNEEVKRRRFVTQKYNLGLSKVRQHTTSLSSDPGVALPTAILKRTTDFTNLTSNDRINIVGFMTFPEPVMNYSRISLPSINILDKSDLNTKHVHYWDMLRQMMSITTHDVQKLDTPLDLNAHSLLHEIKQFVLEPEAVSGSGSGNGNSSGGGGGAAAAMNDRDKYRKFLEVIIPKTRNIFEMMRQYIHGRLTLQDVLAFIEPFLVYQEDLNVKQYDEIVTFLYERVLEYKRNYATNFRKFGRLRSYHYNVRYMGVSMIYKLIATGRMMDADVFKAYGLLDTQVRSATSALPGSSGGFDERQRQQMRGRAYAAGLAEQTEYNEHLLSSSELLSRMLALDYAKLYMDAVAITTTDLITPFDFNLVLGEQSQTLRNLGAMRGGAPGGDGAPGGGAAASSAQPKRLNMVLAKNYPNQEAIGEDNDSDQPVFFDKKYDTTDYDFLESYREQQETMSNVDFSMFLVDELIKKKKMTYENAKKEAEAIMIGPGMRPVSDGDYAVVEEEEYVEPVMSNTSRQGFPSEDDDMGTTQTRFLYYKRENGKWVRDTSIPDVIPSNDLNYFCNVNRSCIPLAMDATRDLMSQMSEIEGAPKSAMTHVDAKEGTEAIKKAFLDKMKAEFDVKYQVTRENFMEFVNKKFEYDLKNIARISEIQHKEFYKYNDRKYKLGFHSNTGARAGSGADADTDAEGDIDAIISPMEPLKDKIIAQTDFVKRQHDILLFITSFTRKANEIMDEDPNWLYCIKSNAKLLPSFYEAIAVAFLQGSGGANSLSVVIDTICKERGTISDDGEAWVDKYSGALIKKIEHVTEEGFDDAGFRLVTRDIIEADLGEGVLNVAKPVGAGAAKAGGEAGLHGMSILEKYDSPNARIINNIITTMTGYMGIDLHSEREFIIQHTLALLETSVPTEEKYREKSERMFREKGKHLPPYKEIFFQTLLLLTLCYLGISIQCVIPSPKTRKTHAGCIRSFSGYPIDGDGDVSGLMYIACIAYKIKTSIEPWNTLKSFKKEGDILAKMKTLMDTTILTKPVIKERLQIKREYLRQGSAGGGGGGEAIPENLSILRWDNFMPPMKSLDNMPTPQNIAADFTNQLITDMKRGYHGQHDKLGVLESKCQYFGLSIQQMIHHIVKNSSPLLLNMASEPFLENACCNEPVDRRSKRVIDYFMEREQNIHHHNRIIGFLTKTLRDMAVVTRPTMIIDNRETRFQYPNIPASFNEQTIYRAFIHYCRMNQQYAGTTSGSERNGGDNPVATAVALYLHPAVREICPPKPQDWMSSDTIDTKISKLKKDSNIFDDKSLERLLKAVNGHKMVDASYKTLARNRPQENTQFQRFQDAVLHLERCDHDREREGEGRLHIEGRHEQEEPANSDLDLCIIPRELRQLILAILNSPTPKYVQEDTEEMRDLKNYLHTKNRELRATVIGFLQQYAKQTKSKFREIERIVDTILDFEINKSSTVLMSATDETTVKSIQFMKNTMARLMDVIPSIINYGVDFDDTNIPKHWGFSPTHMKDIKGIISSHYTSLKTFYNDHVIKEVLRHAEHHIRDLKIMLDHTPFMAEIFFDEEKDAKISAAAAALAVQGPGGGSAFVPREVDIEKELGEKVPHSTRKNIFTMYSVFDRNIVRNLYLFYFLSFMRTFVQLVVETPVTIYQAEPTRVIRRSGAGAAAKASSSTKGKKTATVSVSSKPSATAGAIARTASYREEEDADRDDIDPHSRLYSADVAAADKGQLLSDMDMLIGDKKALGQRVSELMVAYLRMIEKDKAAINFNLANIKEKLTRVKDKEKDGVVERIGAMSVGERQLENMMKTHKMGIWSRGTSQTGIVIYDQDYYDEERDEMEKIAQKERQLGRKDYVTDMNREIYVMDAMEADRTAAEIEAHELDMSSGIPEDDDAGDDDYAFIHRHDDEGEPYEGGGGSTADDWD
jgi:hypothetical protein